MYLPTRSLGSPTGVEVEDRSGSIKVATWILLGVTISVFIARQIMKAVVFRTVAFDDIFICVAMVRERIHLRSDYADMSRCSP
jgi:hypothetical protein